MHTYTEEKNHRNTINRNILSKTPDGKKALEAARFK